MVVPLRFGAGVKGKIIESMYNGVPLVSTTVGLEGIKGIDKLQVNGDAIRADIDDAWELLAEAVQTVMRRYGIPEPYEKLKALTRGQAVTRQLIQDFIAALDIPPDRPVNRAGSSP